MRCDFKQIYLMVENLISSKSLVPMIKSHVYLPTRFLKIGGCLIWFNFLANGTRQSKTLAPRNAFYFILIKQNFCILLDFVVAVAAHLLLKYKKFHDKSPF